MLEGFTDGLKSAFSFIERGRLSESIIREGMRQVRQALLEADVNLEVAEEFVARVTEQSLGEDVLKSIKPSDQIVGIVHNELINLMGPVDHSLHLRRGEITILMLCGLQGSGKTTTCGKLARMLSEAGRKPLLVAADLQRPAAIDQPMGATMRPPSFTWSIRACGTSGPAAVTTTASYGPSSCQP